MNLQIQRSNSIHKISLSSICSLIVLQSLACTQPEPVSPQIQKSIWGQDTRLENWEQGFGRKLADSVAVLLDGDVVHCGAKTCSIDLAPSVSDLAEIVTGQPLCRDEKFPDLRFAQIKKPLLGKTVPTGTGFPIGPNIIATAGHAVRNCFRTWVVFGFRRESASDPLGLTDQFTVPKSNVYRCDKVLLSSNNANEDIAIFRVDRPILDQPILKIAQTPPAPGDGLLVVHHSEGLPLQFSQGRMLGLSGVTSQIDHDAPTLGGASGAPVFRIPQSVDDWEVVGVHVAGGVGSGELPYEATDDGCSRRITKYSSPNIAQLAINLLAYQNRALACPLGGDK